MGVTSEWRECHAPLLSLTATQANKSDKAQRCRVFPSVPTTFERGLGRMAVLGGGQIDDRFCTYVGTGAHCVSERPKSRILIFHINIIFKDSVGDLRIGPEVKIPIELHVSLALQE